MPSVLQGLGCVFGCAAAALVSAAFNKRRESESLPTQIRRAHADKNAVFADLERLLSGAPAELGLAFAGLSQGQVLDVVHGVASSEDLAPLRAPHYHFETSCGAQFHWDFGKGWPKELQPVTQDAEVEWRPGEAVLVRGDHVLHAFTPLTLACEQVFERGVFVFFVAENRLYVFEHDALLATHDLVGQLPPENARRVPTYVADWRLLPSGDVAYMTRDHVLLARFADHRAPPVIELLDVQSDLYALVAVGTGFGVFRRGEDEPATLTVFH